MKDLIAKVDFFSGLDDKIQRKISDACVTRRFARNETIVRAGEIGLGLYVIAKGHVKVDRDQNGVRMPVAELGPEQFFGEMSLLDDRAHSVTLTGIEETECLLLIRDSFVRLMNQYPEIPIHIARALAGRLQLANEKQTNAPPQGVTAPAVTFNGAASISPPASTKAQIHSRLVEIFQSMYTLKALSRFSVAVLGCPVEGLANNVVDQIRIGDVKALFFSASELVEMQIAAQEPGSFTLNVFTPSSDAPYRFGPVAVGPNDHVRMTLLSEEVNLRNGERDIPFH